VALIEVDRFEFCTRESVNKYARCPGSNAMNHSTYSPKLRPVLAYSPKQLEGHCLTIRGPSLCSSSLPASCQSSAGHKVTESDADLFSSSPAAGSSNLCFRETEEIVNNYSLSVGECCQNIESSFACWHYYLLCIFPCAFNPCINDGALEAFFPAGKTLLGDTKSSVSLTAVHRVIP
jgi:hypothetical protein